MAAVIPTCGPDDDVDAMYAAFAEAGCLVVRDLASPEHLAAVRAELSTHVDAAVAAEDDDPADFYPGKTHRVIGLMQRSPTMRELMLNETVEALCDRHLLGNTNKWQLNVGAALEVGPGARDQILHREEDLYPFFSLPRPNLIFASMWAISDFTADNGGTQIVPGSHRWEQGRKAEPDEIARAEMPAGSILFWAGGTLHGAGANVTDDEWRYGVILTYNLGWLRTEENQHVSIPFEDALALPEKLRTRLGFDMDYDGGLGFYDPRVVLNAGS